MGANAWQHKQVKVLRDAGFTASLAKPWLDAGFKVGDESLVTWKKEGFTIAESRQWSDAFGGGHPRQTHSSDIEEMAKWKKEGFAPKEAHAWRAEGFKEPEPFSLQQVAGGPSVAKGYKEAGVAPDVAATFSIAKVEPRQAGTEYQKIDKACGGQILKTTKLIFENPYAAKGKCYLLKGFRTQVVDRTSGLYKMGDLFTMAFFDAYILVDFGKPAPSGMNAVVKVAGTAKLDSGDVIPSAKVVWSNDERAVND